MRQATTLAAVCLCFVLETLSSAPACWGQGLQTNIGAMRVEKPIRSWQEMRQESVVRQKWDMSCGAAALSALFTYDLKVPVSESEIVVWILHRTDPVKIKSRGGFSLLDLKRFARFHGFAAEGYARLNLEELAELGRPAIVATQTKGFNHFMIFRGRVGDRVILTDPAFGNTTLTVRQFQEIWAKGIAFIVLPRSSSAPVRLQPKRSDLLVVDQGMVFRSAIDAGIFRPATR